MISVIGITQFVFLSLGLMAVNILIKVGTVRPNEHPPLSVFLYDYGPWLFLVPICWLLLAIIGTQTNRPAAVKFYQGLGILIAAAILGVFGFAIFFET